MAVDFKRNVIYLEEEDVADLREAIREHLSCPAHKNQTLKGLENLLRRAQMRVKTDDIRVSFMFQFRRKV